MPTIQLSDANGVKYYFQCTQGDGSLANPFIPDSEDTNLEFMLHILLDLLSNPVWLNAALNALQVSQATAANLNCTASIAGAQTLATLTNVAQHGAVPADPLVPGMMDAAWGSDIRAILT
jgi:hypothetical protein